MYLMYKTLLLYTKYSHITACFSKYFTLLQTLIITCPIYHNYFSENLAKHSTKFLEIPAKNYPAIKSLPYIYHYRTNKPAEVCE